MSQMDTLMLFVLIEDIRAAPHLRGAVLLIEYIDECHNESQYTSNNNNFPFSVFSCPCWYSRKTNN